MNNPSDERVDVVTGGAGFVGSHLVDALLAVGHRVRVLDNFSSGRPENLSHHEGNGRLEVIAGDISDIGFTAAGLDGASRVFHLAALSDIVPSIETPETYFRANVDGTFAIVECARRAGVRRLVYAASSSCYGIPDIFPTPETASIGPRYPYALTKYLGEEMVLHWARTYGLPTVSLRLFNVYGPRARTSGTYGAVFGVFLAQLLAGEPLTVVGDGEQTRDFTFVSDVVRAFLMAADSDLDGNILNVGTGSPVSVNRLVHLLGAANVVHIPKRPGEPDVTCADITRLREGLAWEPEVTFEQGVSVMLDHIENWRDAPVWTPARIEEATATWFQYVK